VDGDNFYPVVAVGRFPVVRPDEVTAIVNKTIRYMTDPPAGAWRRDVMFITDESEYFKQASDEIATTLNHEGYSISKVYASDKEADNLAHQTEINKGLDDGQLLVHFIGHGGRYIWRTGPPDLRKNHDLFTLDDVAKLSNRDRLPMILSMTCYSAPFDNPFEDSIGERFLREPDKGAVAVFAASWRNAPSADFSKKLVNALLTPGATIGEAIVKAKKDLSDRVLVEMYNLLGDPAVVLEHSPASLRVERGGDRWNRQLLVAMPSRRFEGTLTVDWLDANGDKLKSTNYQANQSTLSLPIPMFAGLEPTEVRVYASDGGVHRDALGLLRLQPKAPPAAPVTTPDAGSVVATPVAKTPAAKPGAEPASTKPDPASKGPDKTAPKAGKSTGAN
ncbi:MAG: C25 family cysteine peptidase, partial [Dokdonella sp.]